MSKMTPQATSNEPNIRDIKMIDLTDIDRRLKLFHIAKACGQTIPGEVELLLFFGLVEHCLRKGTNPPALLSHNLFERHYDCIRGVDEAKAQVQLAKLRRRRSSGSHLH